MKSKTKIDRQLKKKNNPDLIEVGILSKKNPKWLEISGLISGPRRIRTSLNLSEINDLTTDGDVALIPGKVLSQGEISKKIRIVALNFSEKAKEKLLKFDISSTDIFEEIKKNPDAKGIKILKTR